MECQFSAKENLSDFHQHPGIINDKVGCDYQERNDLRTSTPAMSHRTYYKDFEVIQ